MEEQANEYEIENRDATVTAIEVLDEDRTAEIQSAMEAELDELQERVDLKEKHSEMEEGSDVWDQVEAHLDSLPRTRN